MPGTVAFVPPAAVSVPVVGRNERFPMYCVYCEGRDLQEHAKEMGLPKREPPFFFLKPADTLVVAEAGQTVSVPYPSLTASLHHEIERVLAIGSGGRNIRTPDAAQPIDGDALGLDMARRDLQNDTKKAGPPLVHRQSL